MDSIGYTIIKKLPTSCQSLLLKSFNFFFKNSIFPETWRDNLILFIPKPEGKGFRPISLSSNISKLFERLIHRRLEYIAESKDWFPPFQYGSHKARSSSDCAAVAYTDILLSFEKKESVLAVSLDIKGAYNCV